MIKACKHATPFLNLRYFFFWKWPSCFALFSPLHTQPDPSPVLWCLSDMPDTLSPCFGSLEFLSKAWDLLRNLRTQEYLQYCWPSCFEQFWPFLRMYSTPYSCVHRKETEGYSCQKMFSERLLPETHVTKTSLKCAVKCIDCLILSKDATNVQLGSIPQVSKTDRCLFEHFIILHIFGSCSSQDWSSLPSLGLGPAKALSSWMEECHSFSFLPLLLQGFSA